MRGAQRMPDRAVFLAGAALPIRLDAAVFGLLLYAEVGDRDVFHARGERVQHVAAVVPAVVGVRNVGTALDLVSLDHGLELRQHWLPLRFPLGPLLGHLEVGILHAADPRPALLIVDDAHAVVDVEAEWLALADETRRHGRVLDGTEHHGEAMFEKFVRDLIETHRAPPLASCGLAQKGFSRSGVSIADSLTKVKR